ncbi:MAG: DUF2194 domain-containing protein [Selenomonadaceae bacterium]|nr:DUF2194 domain-containing protein [Selenomonadaceae bacterium]
MNKRHIVLLFLFVMFLGCFFQYARLDGFLHLDAVQNSSTESETPPQEDVWTGADRVARDHYVIIYDPTDVPSMYARHNAEKMLDEQKKSYESHPFYEEEFPIPENTRGIILATGRLGAIADMQDVLDYVEGGGTVVLLRRPDTQEAIPENVLKAFGIQSIGAEVETPGLHFLTNFVIGAKDQSFEKGKIYSTTAKEMVLTADAELEAESIVGMPLIWKHMYGDGQVYGYNGAERDDKTNEGVLASMIAHCGEDSIYPVVGVKLFFIDDFPAPTPEGDFSKIYDETGLSTADFYRKEWWPWMLANAKRYDLKYTGLIIETYGNQVKGPFHELPGRAARDNLVIYGRELLKAGGELGLHGYNHQSLAPAGYHQDKLGYVPWESEQDMIEAMQELHRYVKSLYPDYEFRVYVPPSDILSPEGYDAVKKAVPTIKIMASLYDGLPSEKAFYQDYKRNDDGSYEIPRISSGYVPDSFMRWSVYSLINHLGVFLHFVHPDEMFYKESADKSWADMKDGMTDFLEEIDEHYPWLTPVTASESTKYFDDFFDLDYRVVRAEDHFDLHCWNHSGEVKFLLRSEKELDHADGCTVDVVDDDVYLIRMTGENARLVWKEATP